MKSKDYYTILGVSRTESSKGIQTAFRRLAKEHHPDLAGAEHTCRFQEITEAYEILSDPAARADYNRHLQSHPRVERTKAVQRAGESSEYTSAIRPERASSRQQCSHASSNPDSFFEDLLDRFFTTETFRAANPSWDLEVLLTPDEAEQGGFLPIPVSHRCPACAGSARSPFFPCMNCGGRGRIDAGGSVRVEISPGIADGTVIEVPPTSERGSTNSLRILIRVE